LLENLNGIRAITACDSAPSSKRAIAGSYTHRDTSLVSKVACKVIAAAEYEKRGAVCISEMGANQGAMGAPWKRRWGDLSASLANACTSVFSDTLTGRLLPKRKTTVSEENCGR